METADLRLRNGCRAYHEYNDIDIDQKHFFMLGVEFE